MTAVAERDGAGPERAASASLSFDRVEAQSRRTTTMSTHVDANVSHLASRLAATAKKHKEENGSDEENEDDIFAELEAEIEQESGAGMANMREHGIQGLKEECAVLLRLLCYLVSCSFQD
jgi:hypothetical protein